MRTPLPQECRWVSIADHYPPLQRPRIFPNSHQSRGKNLPERIPLHPPTVIFDSPFRLRPSSPSIILAFHLTTHQLYFAFHLQRPPTLLRSLLGLGLRGRLCSCYPGQDLWFAMPPGFGLQCRASHDPPKYPDQSPRDL